MRNMNQKELAEKAATSQSAVARLEDPDYGRVSLTTLLKLAAAFDVALVVKFTTFDKYIDEYADLSPSALSVSSYEEEKQESRVTGPKTEPGIARAPGS